MDSPAEALDCLVGGRVGCSPKQTGRILTGSSPVRSTMHPRRGATPSVRKMLGPATYCLELGSLTSTPTYEKTPVQLSIPTQASMGDTSNRGLTEHRLPYRPDLTVAGGP